MVESCNKGTICRICLKESDPKIPLSRNQDFLKYSDLIKNCIGLEISENGNCFPTGICKECSSELSTVIKFISKLKLSSEKLQDAVDLNVPFFKVFSKFIKDEDDENIPLSIVSAAIKEERGFSAIIKEEYWGDDISVDKDYFTHNSSDNESNDELKEETKKEEESNLDLSYTILKSKDHGLKKNMVQCLTCGLLVQNRSAFIIHNRKHTGEKPCKCPHCEKSFTQMGTLTDHIKRHHMKDKDSDGSALTEKIRKKLMKSKNGCEKCYTCDTCGKQFSKKNYLTVHMRVHTMEKPYQCSYCPKGFRRCIDFIQHKRIHTGERPYTCSICGKSFVSHTPLKRHLSVHSDERKFKCSICDTAVKSSESLKKHILVMHTSERPNICCLCGAAFALKYNLKAHMKAKHSERSGTCDICKKAFSNLSKHMNTHLGEKLFGCQMCNKRFFRHKGLMTHLVKHQNQSATFTCTFENCNSAFSKQCKLDFHILKCHTNHKPHLCQFCSKGFYRLPDLRRHLKTVHSNCNKSIETLLPTSSEHFHIDNKFD